LRKFRFGGPATFTTWLRAVVRNLCLDWHRSEVGRYRVFQSVARLPSVDRDVFKLAYEEARPAEEVFHILKTRDPRLTDADVTTSLERIRRSLSPRQLWLLSVRSPKMITPEPFQDGQPGTLDQIRDTSPDPESLAALNQRRTTLTRTLRLLPAPDRLLVRLRFEEDLTLEQVARLAGLKDAQTVDRRIRLILAEVRAQMERRGKGPDESV
jgi:RNA polymerase sigma factor (sigma-70 family)